MERYLERSLLKKALLKKALVAIPFLLAFLLAQQLPSGGLGLTKPEWESQHKATGSHPLGTVYDGKYIVIFMNNKVWRIEIQFPKNSGVSESQVMNLGQTLIPQDAKLVKRYSPQGRPETTVLHYESAWYKDDFHIQWKQFPEEGIVVMIVAEGNKP